MPINRTTFRRLASSLFTATTLLACHHALGQPAAANVPAEELVMVPKQLAFGTVELETTLFRPEGPGPFPVVIINHGKAYGDPKFQARYQHSRAARFFLARGYAVVMPMRQGFSKSTGKYIGGGCNVESNGQAQAQDVRIVLEWLGKQPWADSSRVLVMGQSHGGWTTLALGAGEDTVGVRALVNFAGGLRQDTCPGWEANLARAAGNYGKTTRLPSLWFYGDNDSYFSPDTWRSMYESYRRNGGQAELVAFGSFGADSHSMFASRSGERIWQEPVLRLMRTAGLPDAVQYPAYLPAADMPAPPATGFAPLEAAERVPHLKEKGREGYKTFLTKQHPRAFALAPNGAWGWAEMGEDPLRRALTNCQKNAQDQTCQLYAVDDAVVWPNHQPLPPTPPSKTQLKPAFGD